MAIDTDEFVGVSDRDGPPASESLDSGALSRQDHPDDDLNRRATDLNDGPSERAAAPDNAVEEREERVHGVRGSFWCRG